MKELIKNKINSILFFIKPKKIVAQYKLFLAEEWLEASVDSIAPYVYRILFVVSNVAWGDDFNKPKIKNDELEKTIQKLLKKYPDKIIVYRGSWNKQLEHVQAGLDFIKSNIPEATHCLYIDGDEIYTNELIKKLVSFTKSIRYFQKAIRISYNMYFKTIYYKINPIKYPTALVLFPINTWIKYRDVRNVNAATIDMLYLRYEHPAYVRKNDQGIRLKIEAHRETEPIIGNWYENVWLKWTPEMKNFHPTNPEFWEEVIQVNKNELPISMVNAYEKWNNKLE